MPSAEADSAEQLTLFDLGGPDVSKLRMKVAKLLDRARAPATRRAYAIGWVDFERWCKRAGREALPASEETAQLYAVGCLEEGRKLATVEQRIAAIIYAHRQAGHVPPVGYGLRDLLRAARRITGGAPEQKAAIAPRELRRMSAALWRARTVRAVRDRALLVFGFASGLRRSELRALDVGDVRFAEKGVVVRIRRSKTDQEGEGREIGIFAGRRVHSCPVKTLKAWLRVRGRQPGPLFARVDGRDLVVLERLNDKTIGQIVQRAAGMIGLDAAKYGGHSLRAGCATAAAAAGAGEIGIMKRTGHKSLAVLSRYVRHGSLFSVDPLAKAL